MDLRTLSTPAWPPTWLKTRASNGRSSLGRNSRVVQLAQAGAQVATMTGKEEGGCGRRERM